ncbi:nuclear transport factor 2 family protein [Acrocarpospora sp. B8E8]|uniref:nuclear transport factor 2 family protein n=1 Tax=Acrocarpospora sp. B8E8 TaxID=3153572 RepID=UPI00325F5BC7
MPPTANYSPEALAARAEITDRIHLYAHCVDRRRWELLDQVFHDDATWWVSSIGSEKGWREAMESSRTLFAAALDATHHQVGNVLISLDGEVAVSETLCTAYHRVRADAPLGGMFGGTGCAYDLVAGGRYLDRWELRGGDWKLARRRVHSEWRHQQPASDGILSTYPPEARGAYDDTDQSTPVILRYRRHQTTSE